MYKFASTYQALEITWNRFMKKSVVRAWYLHYLCFLLKAHEGFDINPDVDFDIDTQRMTFDQKQIFSQWCLYVTHDHSIFGVVSLLFTSRLFSPESMRLGALLDQVWTEQFIQDIVHGKAKIPLTRWSAAKKIQRSWRHITEDPSYNLCRKRLMHEFSRMSL